MFNGFNGKLSSHYQLIDFVQALIILTPSGANFATISVTESSVSRSHYSI